jgi:hypothetical protein
MSDKGLPRFGLAVLALTAAIKRPWLHRIARVAKRCFRLA